MIRVSNRKGKAASRSRSRGETAGPSSRPRRKPSSGTSRSERKSGAATPRSRRARRNPSRRNRRRGVQLPLSYSRRGGARLGAGRPKKPNAGVTHRKRAELSARHPLHVTLRVLPHVWNLRARRCFNPIRRCLLAGKERFGFRAVEFSVLRDHIHLIVEADDERALSRGMQGLQIRIAKALNRVMKRRGKVFADRYHARVLRTPLEVKNAMVYVLHNAWRHRDEPTFRSATGRAQRGQVAPEVKVDECSSAAFFDWWREKRSQGPPEGHVAYPVVAPRSWLLRVGWRRQARFAVVRR